MTIYENGNVRVQRVFDPMSKAWFYDVELLDLAQGWTHFKTHSTEDTAVSEAKEMTGDTLTDATTNDTTNKGGVC